MAGYFLFGGAKAGQNEPLLYDSIIEIIFELSPITFFYQFVSDFDTTLTFTSELGDSILFESPLYEMVL